ncbi:MAG TPA: CoA-binding protein [Opitutaceae bacterium]
MAVASTDHELREILTQARTIAVVGASADPAKPSHEVAAYLQAQGYRIIPVNPRGGTILGETVYPNLRAVPVPIDLVDVFRPPADCAPIAEEAVAVGAKALWLQLGIANADAARIAEAGGLRVVMDHCTLVEHRRLVAK